jgi:hypothetical protein
MFRVDEFGYYEGMSKKRSHIMSINRKTFLKIAASGGVSALVGMTNLLPRFWSERGVNLITVERQSLVMGSVASIKVIAPTK